MRACFALWAVVCVHSAALAEPLYGRGEALFNAGAQPACGLCHTLSAAGSSGEIGPNLDDLAPSEETVRAAVAGGIGIMPAYGTVLPADDIDALAHYVAKATQR